MAANGHMDGAIGPIDAEPATQVEATLSGVKQVPVLLVELGANRGRQEKRTWTYHRVSATSFPLWVCGRSGANQTFAQQYSDTAGAANLQAAYVGAKNDYMFAMDASGSNSGWQQRRTSAIP